MVSMFKLLTSFYTSLSKIGKSEKILVQFCCKRKLQQILHLIRCIHEEFIWNMQAMEKQMLV